MSTSLAINPTPMSGLNAAIGHAVDNTGNTNVAAGLADSMSPESPVAAFGAYIPDGKIALTKRAAAPVDTGAAGWTSGADTAASGRRSLSVRLGDALWDIAGKLDIGGATRYQKMVAIFNANPDAFTDNNINKLKAGSQLFLPDAQTVLAIDAEQAKQLCGDQIDEFEQKRRGSIPPASPGNTGQGHLKGGDVVVVRHGQTLSGIAAKYYLPEATLSQKITAIFKANPGAFIANNMDRLKSGATLYMPNVEKVLNVRGETAQRAIT